MNPAYLLGIHPWVKKQFMYKPQYLRMNLAVTDNVAIPSISRLAQLLSRNRKLNGSWAGRNA